MRGGPGSELRKDLGGLFAILMVAFVHGLLFVFLMPPWQHYDEPAHFERAWLTARLGRAPTEEEYDATMSRAVIESMIAHQFYADWAVLPDLSPAVLVRVPGFSQVDERPLYYFLAAIPLKFMVDSSIEAQLYAARLVSLLLLLLSVLAGWGIAREVTRSGHPARWMLPMSMALLPGFADVMTAVNSDASAVAAASFFLWGSVRLVRRGISALDLAWTLAALGLALFTKKTAYPVVAIFPIVLCFALFRGKWRRLAWALVGLVFLVIPLLAIQWDDVMLWQRYTSQDEPMRLASPQAVLGRYVLGLDLRAPITPSWNPPASHILPVETARPLGGQPVTLGAWIWADAPTSGPALVIGSGDNFFSRSISLDREPQFYAIHATLPEESWRTWVDVAAQMSADGDRPAEGARWIFFDGIVMVEGHRPLDEAPVFSGPEGLSGEWGGQAFTNLLRNPSFEQAGPRFRPWLDNLGARVSPNNIRPSLLFTFLFDTPGTSWFLKASLLRLVNTFWGWFGWGHVALIGTNVYTILLWITWFLLGGALIAVLRRWRSLQWDMAFVLGLALALSWVATLLRGVIFLVSTRLYVPVARYTFPAIIPLLLLLCLGWLEFWYLGQWIWNRWVLRGRPSKLAVEKSHLESVAFFSYLFCLLALDVWSVMSIWQYYSSL